jgi:hypothetical protein
VGVGVVKVVCLLQQRDLQGTQKGSMDQFQELVNLDQLPLGRQRNGLGKLPHVGARIFIFVALNFKLVLKPEV